MNENRRDLPIVTISHRGADRLRAGHVWVYRSEVIGSDPLPPGTLVTVREHISPKSSSDRNVRATRTLGTAFYSSSSEIALRIISPKLVSDLYELLRGRIRDAIAYRERFVQNTNAYRVIFSEGDFLPGLMVDRYNDILSIQVLTQAMDSEQIRELVVSELAAALNPAAIIERVDARVRRLEQLPEKESGIVYRRDDISAAHVGTGALTRPAAQSAAIGEHGSPGRTRASGPTREQENASATEFQMNGLRFIYEALGTQKTGAFLDQRENYATAAQYARGEALDVFCYQGGFALHLARVSEKVTGVDSSRPALEIADKNAALNGKEIEWIEANAFDLLRDYSDAGRQYDCVVLDPPAFAKSKRDLPTALRGYKELNLRALKMLRPAGILVTCSCSYHVSASDLLQTLQSAAQDSHRIVRILENRGAAKDHPSVLGIPETAYLKCLIVLVS
ncbi:MAG TPA: class I SAM-dependent rRNA methyltransferase [Terriglobales bacterium]|nr:class I SAM-dependent rRNA methyltransferase [Terriglobales bacterium]